MLGQESDENEHEDNDLEVGFMVDETEDSSVSVEQECKGNSSACLYLLLTIVDTYNVMSTTNNDIALQSDLESQNEDELPVILDTGCTTVIFDHNPSNVRKWCYNVRKLDKPKWIGGIGTGISCHYICDSMFGKGYIGPSKSNLVSDSYIRNFGHNITKYIPCEYFELTLKSGKEIRFNFVVKNNATKAGCYCYTGEAEFGHITVEKNMS